jgi:thioredoxin 2
MSAMEGPRIVAQPPAPATVSLRCAHCLKNDDLETARAHAPPPCPRCDQPRAPLAVPMVVETIEAFDAIVDEAGVPVLVDWWSPLCGPCAELAPLVDEVTTRRAGDFLVAKVDTLALPQLAQRERIRATPTLTVHRGGRLIARSTGLRPARLIELLVDHASAKPAAPTRWAETSD